MPDETADQHNRPAQGEVLIRMYGQGVGDCFLLMFPRTDQTAARPTYNVVIDCGVVGGTPDPAVRMKKVVQNIRAATADSALPRHVDGKPKGHIDLLAITHEHWDHLSGFVQAEEEWQAIQVDELWTAWTEEPGKDLPDALKNILAKQKQALEAAADQAFRMGALDQNEVLTSLMGFYSDGSLDDQGFAVAKGVSDAFDIAKSLVKPNPPIFCEPGDVRPLPGTAVQAYVLGPPSRDEFLVRMSSKKETYEGDADKEKKARETPAPPNGFMLQAMAESNSPFSSFAMPLTNLLSPVAPPGAGPVPGAAGPLTDEQLKELGALRRSFAIEASLRAPLPSAESDAHDHPTLESYFDPVNGWRRIDADWLGVSAEFALRADSLTNNTSLVLAFELPPKDGDDKRHILLFTGDAQVGSWLSWETIDKWRPIDGAMPTQQKPDINDFLARTVFYKVGHHGSHNATLKGRGVEKMGEVGNLTAFVPVSKAVAHEIKDWREMPLTQLLNALSERAIGRVVLPNARIWRGTAPDGQAAGLIEAQAKLPPVVRKKDKVEVEGETPLWVQMAIPY